MWFSCAHFFKSNESTVLQSAITSLCWRRSNRIPRSSLLYDERSTESSRTRVKRKYLSPPPRDDRKLRPQHKPSQMGFMGLFGIGPFLAPPAPNDFPASLSADPADVHIRPRPCFASRTTSPQLILSDPRP